MIFDGITQAPPDPILGLMEAFKKDPRPDKVNLGVGVFQNEHGRTPILDCVKQAEKRLLDEELSKSYLPIVGSPVYGRCVQDLIFGVDNPAVKSGRVQTAHTPGGTGGLRVGAEFLKLFRSGSRVWLSAPTWANHNGVFAAAGFALGEYPYYDAARHGLDFDAMIAALRAVPSGDVVLLHVSCHNPTGVDLDAAQWKEIAKVCEQAGWTPFFDFAYQGFGEGLAEDREPLAAFLDAGIEFFVASSFSKNFGLYNERVGGLSIVADTAETVAKVFSHVKRCIRVLYSNPASHGGSIVETILGDAALRSLWEGELAAMRDRIHGVRHSLTDALSARDPSLDFSFITRQRGMFSFSGLTDAQVAWLREQRGVYMVKGGRINVAGVTPKNLDYLCDSIHEALREARG